VSEKSKVECTAITKIKLTGTTCPRLISLLSISVAMFFKRCGRSHDILYKLLVASFILSGAHNLLVRKNAVNFNEMMMRFALY
jgi:hypothetical protein